ncbi:MAG TPA: L-glutamate gamma-semialdehyde dehydrogenase, partial [Burkholderiaceae bacterium]
QRLGAQTVVGATVRAIQLLGRQFVLGRDIVEAQREAAQQRRAAPHGAALRFSYDMLGEGARTEPDAQRYLGAYRNAIDALAAQRDRAAGGPETADGISIKLSALFSRYEDAQRARVAEALLPRVAQLVERAARADLNLTIDAEESDRLELSLDVFERLADRIAREHPRWRGFGLAVQAYQTRAPEVVDEVARIARAHGLRFMVRLVKGAYWDAEIKRAQELGLAGYPVFTHKRHTDIAYLACARALLGHADAVYPQFATHNAGTIAAIVQMAREAAAPFELQRLHGMGEGVYREVLRQFAPGLALRVYAPVGEHRDLLAYLVRRLLENGANSSFVHQLADASVDVETLLAAPPYPPGAPLAPPSLPLPSGLYGPARTNSSGLDLASPYDRRPIERALAQALVPAVREAIDPEIDATLARLAHGFPAWNARAVPARAAVLRRAADDLQERLPGFVALLVREAHKTLPDALAEVREAIDFLRYYAAEGEARLAPQALPGPTGESNELRLHGRGVFVCISPWNFPLAIFGGQVAAALVAGNAVAAKPAEQTPAVAAAFVELLHAADVPLDALALLHGPGETVGAALVADARIAGVCFTGSTAVAKSIQRALAAKDGPIVPLVAETGGINAMIVDSTALPEQVVDAVVQSAFRSAGQRCSALRVLAVHEGIADAVIAMIAGALRELVLGDPAELATDVGPVIDAEAHATLERHVERLRREATLIGEAPLPSPPRGEGQGEGPAWQRHFIAPIAFEVARIADVRQEIFGPVLHVVRWSGDVGAVIDQVNALGYGLTLGVQTRIDSRALALAARARIGNVYVNRNMIGAVVGVQPFGGEGLSGTGPKAGGPNYLPRFCAEQTLTINTAAAGGNVALFTALE